MAPAEPPSGAEPPAKPPAKPAAAPAELSVEDSELKAALLLMVERAGDADAGVQRLALESLRREIRTATRRVQRAALCTPRRGEATARRPESDVHRPADAARGTAARAAP